MLGREAQPTAIVLDGRVLQSTPESGHRAGYNGGKRRKGSTAHIAMDTLGHLLSVVITPANEQERACKLPPKVGQLKVEEGVIFSPSTCPYEKEPVQ